MPGQVANPRDNAEMIAARALAFLAADPARLGRFLAVTGLGPQTLRASAREPQFLAQVLQFIGEDESLLIAFAANEGLEPKTVAAARERLAPRFERDVP